MKTTIKRKLEPPSENNWEIVLEIHQQAQSQTEEVQANEFIDNGRSCSTPLQGLMKAPREWPTIIEQDGRPLREANVGVPDTGKGPRVPRRKIPPTRKWEKWANQITS
ncbi:hypothetical protein NDU88_007294 [Pleurodeles waltl]|uniref:Uncharacterized protein n=1 Tax=Pleurodeles waltl TaxID=8319 RepID=A0AAV7SS72_PLEWA|nr:hypothetical protein NDU88_007294 [Pleurodeles waltl]